MRAKFATRKLTTTQTRRIAEVVHRTADFRGTDFDGKATLVLLGQAYLADQRFRELLDRQHERVTELERTAGTVTGAKGYSLASRGSYSHAKPRSLGSLKNVRSGD